jgi:hypothetical protein
MPHVIRLRGPWECVPQGMGSPGAIRFTRRFNRPTGLDADSRVWLAIDDALGHAVVSLNGQSLGEVQPATAETRAAAVCRPARFDITAAMLPRNVLAIAVTDPRMGPDGQLPSGPGQAGHPSGLIGPVRLEIE